MRRSCRSFGPPTWLPNRGLLARLPLPCATTGTQATPKEQVEVIEMTCRIEETLEIARRKTLANLWLRRERLTKRRLAGE